MFSARATTKEGAWKLPTVLIIIIIVIISQITTLTISIRIINNILIIKMIQCHPHDDHHPFDNHYHHPHGHPYNMIIISSYWLLSQFMISIMTISVIPHYDHQHHFHFTSPSMIGLTAPSHRTSRRSDTSPMIPTKSTTTWVTRITTRLKWRTWSVKPSTLPNSTVHPQELIKKYGAKNFNFHQYRAHYHGQVRKGDKPFNPLYEPPGYQADIASGIYQPDQERPQVKNFKINIYFKFINVYCLTHRMRCRQTTCLRGDMFPRLWGRKKIVTYGNCAGYEEMFPQVLISFNSRGNTGTGGWAPAVHWDCLLLARSWAERSLGGITWGNLEIFGINWWGSRRWFLFLEIH